MKMEVAKLGRAGDQESARQAERDEPQPSWSLGQGRSRLGCGQASDSRHLWGSNKRPAASYCYYGLGLSTSLRRRKSVMTEDCRIVCTVDVGVDLLCSPVVLAPCLRTGGAEFGWSPTKPTLGALLHPAEAWPPPAAIIIINHQTLSTLPKPPFAAAAPRPLLRHYKAWCCCWAAELLHPHPHHSSSAHASSICASILVAGPLVVHIHHHLVHCFPSAIVGRPPRPCFVSLDPSLDRAPRLHRVAAPFGGHTITNSASSAIPAAPIHISTIASSRQ